jgi:hypothetical protein
VQVANAQTERRQVIAGGMKKRHNMGSVQIDRKSWREESKRKGSPNSVHQYCKEKIKSEIKQYDCIFSTRLLTLEIVE